MKKQMRRLLGIIISAMLLITYAFPVMAEEHNHHSGDKPIEYKEEGFTITLTKPDDDKIKNDNAKYGAYQIFSGAVPAKGSENAPTTEQLKDPGTDGTALPITDIKWGNAFGEVNSEIWQKHIVEFVYALAKAPSGTYKYAFNDFKGFEGFAGAAENQLADRFYYTGKPKTNANVNFDKLAVEVVEVLQEPGHDHEWLQAFTDILGGYAAGESGYLNGNYVTQYYAGDWKKDDTSKYEIKVPAGYYMILDLSTIDESSAADYSEAYSARMLFVANNVEQELKSSVPTLEKKIVRDEGEYETDAAGVGDTVKFRLTGTLPTNIDNYIGGYKYIFTDNLSKGLTLDKDSVKVTVTGLWYTDDGEKKWYEGTPLTIEVDSFSSEAPNHEHVIDKAYSIDVKDATTTAGQTLIVSFPCLREILIDDIYTLGYNEKGSIKTSQIYVEYTATLNKDAVVEPADSTTGEINGNKNTAQLEYSNNPQAYADTDMTTFDDATVYTFGLDLTKVDSAEFTKDPEGTAAKLPGAVFALVRPNANTESSDKYEIARFDKGSILKWEPLTGSTEENLKEKLTDFLYEKGGEEKAINADCILTSSDPDGKINITGLNDDVVYTMVEVKAPDGYATIDPFSFTLTAATEKDGEGKDTGEYNGKLENTDITKGESDGTLSLTQYVINKNESPADTNGITELTVANFAYENLPSTGGIGTYIFYIVGGIIVLGAVVLLLLSRKKKVTE